jgi:hypothetical protein
VIELIRELQALHAGESLTGLGRMLTGDILRPDSLTRLRIDQCVAHFHFHRHGEAHHRLIHLADERVELVTTTARDHLLEQARLGD